MWCATRTLCSCRKGLEMAAPRQPRPRGIWWTHRLGNEERTEIMRSWTCIGETAGRGLGKKAVWDGHMRGGLGLWEARSESRLVAHPPVLVPSLPTCIRTSPWHLSPSPRAASRSSTLVINFNICVITAMQTWEGNLWGKWDHHHPTYQFGSGYQQIWEVCRQIWVFYRFFSCILYTTNTLIDAKYLYGKNMPGMGVGWCGLIGPWSKWGEKRCIFQKANLKEPEKEQSPFKCFSWCVFFFHPPVVCCLRERWEQPPSPSVGACHIVLLQFYISIKAM